ncbi:plasmid fertility inhibition factor family protein [Massilia eurypsychrophila]|uniref:plasmid fertility inhibition factor family protein n=1 Tax=Massilia eurypsychrophila TaxID=1485217 RepID=UPI0035F4D73F
MLGKGRYYLNFTNGITRTIYLLANGVKQFPVLCERHSAELLVQLAGSSRRQPLLLSALKDQLESTRPY